MIQMLKKLLRCVLGKACLNYEELNSVLCDCEAVINSRPLTYLSEEPNEITPLTPAMFLQENWNVDVIDMDKLDSESLSKRIKYLQKLTEDLRKRFRSDYLSQLILHQGKFQGKMTLKIGDIVLIGSDNKKRLDWPLGRVCELYPGKDGIIRVVKVKTASGEFIRPVQRLYPLEVSSTNQTGEKTAKDGKRYAVKSFPKPTLTKETVITSTGRLVKIPKKLLQFEL